MKCSERDTWLYSLEVKESVSPSGLQTIRPSNQSQWGVLQLPLFPVHYKCLFQTLSTLRMRKESIGELRHVLSYLRPDTFVLLILNGGTLRVTCLDTCSKKLGGSLRTHTGLGFLNLSEGEVITSHAILQSFPSLTPGYRRMGGRQPVLFQTPRGNNWLGAWVEGLRRTRNRMRELSGLSNLAEISYLRWLDEAGS